MHAGDTLSLLALRPLKDNRAVVGERLSALLFEETERVAWETAEGQALDLGWTRDNRLDITEEDYLHMVLKKTCWFSTIHPCRAGALIGTRGRIDPDALVRYGFLFGAAFQIHDDWLNLSPGAKYGKERDGDLREGKRTLLLAHAVAHATSGERVEIARILNKARADKSESEIAWLRRVFERTGAFDHAQQMALGLAGAAQHEFDRVAQRLPRSRDREFLRAIPRWVLSRTH
jgi:geranylgeranyl diphosphate synthase type II